MTTFVQIHALRDYGPSLPNGDRDGLAKKCHYGDAERQRISSQCIKAALRAPTLGLAELAIELGLDMSVRSPAVLSKKLTEYLKKRGMSENDSQAYAKGVALAFVGKDEQAKVQDDGTLPQPIVVGEHELELLADSRKTSVLIECVRSWKSQASNGRQTSRTSLTACAQLRPTQVLMVLCSAVSPQEWRCARSTAALMSRMP